MKFRFFFLATWASIILILCGMPPKDVNEIAFINFPHIDKVVHFILYVILGLSVMGVLSLNKWLKSSKITYVISIFICFLYGWIIEILQRDFFTGRSYDLADVAADTAGAIVGVFLYKTLRKLVAKRQH